MSPLLFRRDIATDGDNKNDPTIAIAIALGVGIPVVLAVLIIVIVTVRHRRKAREEDEKNEAIDDNEEVPFETFSSKTPHRVVAGSSFGQSTDFDSFVSRPITHRGPQGLEKALFSDNGSSTFLYTPDMDAGASQEGLARALHTVYGPSPSYPSTERLRTFSKQSSFAGPFDTPPRNGLHSPGPSFSNSTIPSPHPHGNFSNHADSSLNHSDSLPSRAMELSDETTGSVSESQQPFDFFDPNIYAEGDRPKS